MGRKRNRWEFSLTWTFCVSLKVFALLLLLLLSFYLRVFFPTSSNWCILTGVWVTASLLNSPRTLLSILADFNSAVIWLVSILLLVSSSPQLFLGTWLLFQGLQLQVVSLSPSCSITFSVLSQSPNICPFFFFFFFCLPSLSVYNLLERQNPLID